MNNTMASLQRAWIAMLLHPEQATNAARGWRGGVRGREAGVAVYVNSIRATVLQALADSFPATRKLLGRTAFQRAAMACLQRHPPNCANLAEYGAAMIRSIAAFATPAQQETAVELARYEWSLDELRRGRRETPWRLKEAAAVPGDRWADLRLRLAGHARLFVSRVPVRGWAEHLLNRAPIPSLDGECLLLVGADDAVSVIPLELAEYRWLQALQKSRALEAATKAGLETDPGFCVQSLLLRMLSAQGLVRCDEHEGGTTGDSND